MATIEVAAPPAEGTPPPAPPADNGAASTPPTESTPRLFFSKPDGEAPEKPETFDPSTLDEKLQLAYKSMQADYTRKTQTLADERRKVETERRELMDERERFLTRWEAAQRKPEAETQPSNLIEQIQQLRGEGRHDEADQLLVKATEQVVAPIKTEAEVARRQAQFQNTVAEIKNTDPIVGAYFKDVAAIWDSGNPAVKLIREALLKDSTSMQALPIVFNIIARAVHAERVEADLDRRIKSERKSAVESEKERARKIPNSLIETGGQTKEGKPGKMSVRDAAMAAVRDAVGAA